MLYYFRYPAVPVLAEQLRYLPQRAQWTHEAIHGDPPSLPFIELQAKCRAAPRPLVVRLRSCLPVGWGRSRLRCCHSGEPP